MPHAAHALEPATRATLDEAIAQDRGADPMLCIAVGIAICDALTRAHARSRFCHDLAPSTIVLHGDDPNHVEVDLEPALQPEDDHAFPRSLAPLTSPAYISPERACGLEIDARSDLYSLGCILFELATGVPPFRASSLHDLVLKHVMVDPPRTSALPSRLGAIIARLLRKEPRERFQSASELRSALKAARDARRQRQVARHQLRDQA
ncbi:MAG: hypothetical protein SFX73_22360 [Kofleriaceae bacterium]|nr:hypothetical protein [Kofleriaceae bacterium]